jgi:soluble lytic murein transglycosylase-like protein
MRGSHAFACFLTASLALAPLAALAEDFTFRRIAVAPAGSGPRITVQIDPEEQARRLAPPAPRARQDRVIAADPAAPAGASGSLAWFWERVPWERGAVGGRFQLAIRALDDGPGGRAVPRPRMQPLQRMAEAHGSDILRATVGTAVSPALALAVIAVESAGRADAVSHAGAQGLMQLIPATAQRFGVTDAFDATQNIAGGVAYLDWLMRQFDRDVVLALAGYNAGEGAVQRSGGVPNYAETRDYVPKVLAAWTVARGLCTEPPQLPSDPCIFRIGQLRAAQASPRAPGG